jgi:hypothetical protein
MSHISINPGIQTRYHRKIKDKSRELGLDKIKHIPYDVYKVGSKTGSVEQERRVITGVPTLCGNSDAVWLLIEAGTWYKTSPVVSCVQSDNGFLVETENSVYELVKY